MLIILVIVSSTVVLLAASLTYCVIVMSKHHNKSLDSFKSMYKTQADLLNQSTDKLMSLDFREISKERHEHNKVRLQSINEMYSRRDA